MINLRTRAVYHHSPMATAKRPKKKPEATTAPAAEPSPSARRAYAKLMAVIETAEVTEARGFDEKWEAIDEVRRKHYYVLDEETPSFVAWLKKHVGEPARSARRNLRVSAVASPAEIARYLPTKIDLALAIRDATERKGAKRSPAKAPEGASLDERRPAPIDLAALRYEVVREKKRARVDLAEVTQQELEALLSERTGSAEKKRRERDEQLSPTVATAKKALVAAGLDEVVLAQHDQLVTIADVRVDQLAALGAVLAKVKPRG